MAVWRSQREFAHSPRLVLGDLGHVGAGCPRPTVKCVDVVDVQVGNVAVIAELGGSGYVRAAAEHEGDFACAAGASIPGLDIVELAPKNVPIPIAGHVQVMDRQHRI